MRVLSLFSGGGLGDYGLELAGMTIVAQVEIDPYCQKVLALRWPEVPKWGDIKIFDGKKFVKEFGQPDLIFGGFPCVDISSAGCKEGIKGSDSSLWKEMFRIICEIRPRFCFVENVSALLYRGLDVVLGDLASIGFDAEWECLPANAFGAPHRRFRVWIIGYPNKNSESISTINDETCKLQKTLSNTSIQRLQGDARPIIQGNGCRLAMCDWWRSEPAVGRVDDGTPKRMDRLKLLGNGQVVQVVQWIGERIMEFEANP